MITERVVLKIIMNTKKSVEAIPSPHKNLQIMFMKNCILLCGICLTMICLRNASFSPPKKCFMLCRFGASYEYQICIKSYEISRCYVLDSFSFSHPPRLLRFPFIIAYKILFFRKKVCARDGILLRRCSHLF